MRLDYYTEMRHDSYTEEGKETTTSNRRQQALTWECKNRITPSGFLIELKCSNLGKVDNSITMEVMTASTVSTDTTVSASVY